MTQHLKNTINALREDKSSQLYAKDFVETYGLCPTVLFGKALTDAVKLWAFAANHCDQDLFSEKEQEFSKSLVKGQGFRLNSRLGAVRGMTEQAVFYDDYQNFQRQIRMLLSHNRFLSLVSSRSQRMITSAEDILELFLGEDPSYLNLARTILEES